MFRPIFYLVNKFLKKKNNSLLILKLDEIGDYILFRNFIDVLKKDIKYKNYTFTLCGNIVWRNIAENFDKKDINKFIWIDKNKYSDSKLYRSLFKIKIHLKKYDVLIHPTYSRSEFTDEFVKEFDAALKIGSIGDTSNMNSTLKNKYDQNYSLLLKTSPKPMFEFYRNIEFFEQLLGYTITIKKPYCNINDKHYKILKLLTNKYITIFPGASHVSKRWSAENFQLLTNYLLTNYKYDIVLVGSKEDKKTALRIIQNRTDRIYDFTGRTSLTQLIQLIKKSELLITHDTSAVHIAAMFDKKTICIFNGTYYGRFVPYPKEMLSNLHLVLPQELNMISDFNLLVEKFKHGSTLNINSIQPKQVIQQVTEIVEKI